MAQIDTQAIIDAITLKLRTEYPNAVIDHEDAPQGITPGAILVNLTNAGQSQLNPHRFHRSPQFDVLYFSDNSNADCAAVADNLCMVLETVTTPAGDVLHGSGMTWSVEDFVLHFLVSYNHNVIRPTERITMENLKFQEEGR